MPFVLIAFILFRVFDFIIAFVAPAIIPYLGFFPYREQLETMGMPQWLYSFANFDGIHYMNIADQGYQQYEEAFFPLYPLLMHAVAPLFGGNQLITGMVVANLAFLGGLWLFVRLCRDLKASGYSWWWPVILLLIFPTSFYFGAVYTEGLFLFTSIGYIYFLHKKNYGIAGVFGFFAALTRLVGVFLVLHFLTVLIIEILQKQTYPKALTIKSIGSTISHTLSRLLDGFLKKPISLLPFFLPLAGLITYMSYLLIRTGDALFFLSAQPMFGANRSTNLILLPQVLYRYLKIFLTADRNYQYWGAVMEFTLFLFTFGVLLWGIWQLWQQRTKKHVPFLAGLIMFSLSSMILPTLTGTLTSTTRYAVMALGMYFILAQAKSWIRWTLVAVFIFFHALLLGLFLQGYFVG